MADIIKRLKQIYEKYFKCHCPDCGGVLDAVFLDMEFDSLVYECRECKMRRM